jgi:DNA processing protein
LDTLSERREARALLVLDQLRGVDLQAIARLAQAFGSAERALAAPHRAFAAVAGAGPAALRGDPAVGALVDRGLAEADRLGMRVCTWGGPVYPARLRHLADPPPVLFLRGRPELTSGRTVAVVGARRATTRAREVAERIGFRLAGAGVTVVSGLALGVDGAAHRGALDAGGDTVAVLGRGADRAYPLTHRRLFDRIVERGLVVSEFLPGTPPLKHHFPRRNRILAALSDLVVVVEAAVGSGALSTSRHALDLGRDIWAVPGPIDTAACEGVNQLIRDGASPLISIPDFVHAVSGQEERAAQAELRPSGPEGRVLDELGDECLGIDLLASRAGMAVSQTLALLTALELAGWVRQLPGMRFRRAA